MEISDLVPMLLHRLAEREGVSLPNMARQLGIQTSELQRVLTALGPDHRMGGLGLVEQRAEGARTRLWLTAAGRALCERA